MASRTPPRTSLTTRTTCRVCDSPQLAPVLSLGDQCIAGAFAEPGRRASRSQRPIPLELVRCDMTRDQNACGLIQTRHTVPGAILYSNYWYRSGVNRTMTENLHEIARDGRAARRACARRPGRRHRLQRRDAARRIPDRRAPLSRLRPLRRHALRGREGLRRGPRLLFVRAAPAAALPDRKAQRDHERSRCSTTSRTRARSSRTSSSALVGGRRLGDGAALPADDARAQCVRRDRARAPRVLLARRHRAADHARPAWRPSGPGSTTSTADRSGCSSPAPGGSRSDEDDRGRCSRSAIREFELALDSPEPYERFTPGRRADPRRAARPLPAAARRGQDDPRLRRVDQGQHDPPVRGHRRLGDPLRRRPQPGQVGLETIRTHIPIISEEESRAMKPDYYLVLPWHFLDEFLERETGVPRRRRPLHRPAARGPHPARGDRRHC